MEKAYSRRHSLREAQELVPEHERILTLADASSMLDFVRNPIWATGDNPGECSPPPGLLKLNSPSDLRNYLIGLGISYILFEPITEKITAIEKRLASPTETYLDDPWDYNEVLAEKRVLQSVAQLAEKSRVQRSDNYEVIELASPPADKP